MTFLSLINWNAGLFVNAIVMGFALAMDAFSVSIANSLQYPLLNKKKQFFISGTFGLFQGLMPLIGWALVYYLSNAFEFFAKYIVPSLALLVLSFIGIKMILEYKNNDKENIEIKSGTSFFIMIVIQALATSIDALSVGLTISHYDIYQALVSCIIIAIITFVLCLIGVILGKKIGSKIGNKAILIGGIILIIVGCFIFTKGMLDAFMPGLIPNVL